MHRHPHASSDLRCNISLTDDAARNRAHGSLFAMTKCADKPALTPAPEVPLLHGLITSKAVAVGCILLFAGLGWIYVALLVAGHMAVEPAEALGPGMGVFDMFARERLGAFALAVYEVICRASFGHQWAFGTWSDIGLTFAMWVAMTLAMMLPTAAPMILTYTEIAHTVVRKGESIASPLALTTGYAAIWVGFAVAATALQVMLTKLALLDPAMGMASPLFSAAIFLAAGAYQYSKLKDACVTICQRPFPFFLTNWSTEARKLFRLGLRQGLYCLGCCWAMMLLMFAVGIMNVVWMAALGLVMATEKIATSTRVSRIVGAVFALIGIVLIANAITFHWPTRAA
jgi:predicted metal-binding membrane protein